MRASVMPGLSTSTLALGPLRLGTTWAAVDMGNAEVVSVLLAYVGSHVQLHPDDVTSLAEYGLAFEHGRLIRAPLPTPSDSRSESDDSSKTRRRK